MPSPDDDEGNGDPTHSSPTVVDGSPRRSREPAERTAGLTKGTSLGRYVVLDTLGAGGMGVVYAAYDPELNRKVALKVMQPRAESEDDDQARIRREAQALARLAHPNVVAVFDVGAVGDRVFVAMELVDGQTLAAWLRKAKRTYREILDAFVAAGKGLAAAHAAGVIHRDFKPANVLVGNDGRVRVMDFGLARAGAEEPEAADALARSLSRDVLQEDVTVTGSILGTPLYMAPEAFRGEGTDEAGDQFSFCVALFEALYGRPPFDTKRDARDPERWVVRDVPRGRVPSWIHALVMRGLERSAAARHPSMTALVDALGRDPSRRNRRLLAGLVLVIAAAGVVGVSRVRHARAVAACDDEGAAIASAWNDVRATQIGNAFAATGVSYAPDTWNRTRTRLDAYAREWQTTRARVCKRADVDDTLAPDLARAARSCLDGQRDELIALVESLVKPDAAIIQQAATASAQLPLAATCTDETQLRRHAEPPASVRERVRTLRRRLAQAKIANALRRHDQAIAQAQAVAAEADPLAWTPLAAEARYEAGYAQGKIGRDADAKQSLEQAFYAAGAAGRDELAAQAASRLTFVVGYQQARTDEGLVWGRIAQMFIDRLGSANELVAGRLLNALGIVEFQGRGNRAVGLELFERGLAILERTLGASHLDVALAHNNVGIAYSLHGQNSKARDHLERAVVIYEEALGPAHPELGKALVSLGDVHHELGEYQQAIAHGTRGLAIVERAFGAQHRDTAYALHLIGRAHTERGQLPEALAALERGLAIDEKVFNKDHPQVGLMQRALGVVHRELGKLDTALEIHTRALEIYNKAYAPGHPDAAEMAANLGYTYLARGEHAKARPLFERALASQDKETAEHPDVATSLVGLGRVELALGDAAAALPRFTRALAIREKALGKHHPLVADALEALAELQLRTGERTQARAALERALVIRERVAAPAKSAATKRALADVEAADKR